MHNIYIYCWKVLIHRLKKRVCLVCRYISVIRKLKIFFWRLFFITYPSYHGSQKWQKKTIINQKMKIIVLGCLIAQMKRFDVLITTQNPQLSVKSHFGKNQEKLDFLRNGTLQRDGGNQCIKTMHLRHIKSPERETYPWY